MPEALILDCVSPSRVYLLKRSTQIHGTWAAYFLLGKIAARLCCCRCGSTWYATQYGPYTVTKPEDYPGESDSIHAPQLAVYSCYLAKGGANDFASFDCAPVGIWCGWGKSHHKDPDFERNKEIGRGIPPREFPPRDGEGRGGAPSAQELPETSESQKGGKQEKLNMTAIVLKS
ncbi:predicted protein [Histoplasma capsulatum G186AR]|uniref:Uncharacterized protein n=1 Tax=Ajellomyces capsulatus (strain G186AR / H82 / ATCC MYA-2454 / RMSCC 2432) TaxID=447093 RepID=C0NZ21_AJECG|nr:uncharacterized protein HCBG_08401 [Histoplasma capsulatum G186AR]EEH03461.1 predicted protein [Histoplasma capsulatum G186AR]